ncbi:MULTISPECIES: hypothetical protein [Burkholderiaceae]|uniref:hypothetical protein n=1 Tax=Burkholderiaceae TaxID=119060 RepID=UPI000963E444|nr:MULTISPECIES: hypothetical protein [Burkholderiaceae]MCG1017390.1 hypothetical protein [Mycetohabitans sp. B4]SIT70421.1 hypothetical protein SAMN04487768_1962 [Burkholderia sp. b13]
MKKKHCLQPKGLSVMLSVITMLVGCGGNTPNTLSPNDKDLISPTSGPELSVLSKESRTPGRLTVEPVEVIATSFADIQAANAALRASPAEQHINPNNENIQLPFLTEGAPPIATPLAPRSPDVERASAESASPLLQNIRATLEINPNTSYHNIKDENLERLVFRLIRRFRLDADSIPFVIKALNKLYHRGPEYYAALSDVYGDPAEEHHRRYEHVSSLFDIIRHSAMETEPWRERPNPFFFSDALKVLAQAILLQKSAEQEQGTPNLVDFSEVCEKFESYFNEHDNMNIPIDLNRIKLKLSGNSVSLSESLAPRILKLEELSRADRNLGREGLKYYLSYYSNALQDAAKTGVLKDGDFKDILESLQKKYY